MTVLNLEYRKDRERLVQRAAITAEVKWGIAQLTRFTLK
jgi:hypothetical protein